MNRQWILKARPEGAIDPSIFEERTVEIPPLEEGQVLAQTLYLSFDPTQRGWMARDTYMPKVPLGEPMRAGGCAQVIESKHSKFKVGDIIGGYCNWQTLVLFDPNDKEAAVEFQKVPGHLDVKRMLSMMPTCLTAYFGMLDIGQPKPGETVLISGAAGATGSVAGQIAKIKGCRVIGIAGGPEKCAWLVETAHFDEAIDYKNQDVNLRIQELCPNGVDVFFDNVGGEILDTALLHLAQRARVVLCGAISQYNLTDEEKYGLKHTTELTIKRARAEGFIILDYMDRTLEGTLRVNDWMESGEIVLEFDVQEGFDNIPSTLQRLFQGANTGKQVLKVSDPPVPVHTNMVEQAVMKILSIFYSWRR